MCAWSNPSLLHAPFLNSCRCSMSHGTKAARSGKGFPGINFQLVLLAALVSVHLTAFSGQTGKIAGRVVDATTGESLIGANVILLGTTLGASTDIDGFYTINNIPPGKYSVVVNFIGYRRLVTTDVIVKIDLTTRVDAKLQPQAIEVGEVVVRAERPIVQKDLTSTSVTMSSDDLKRIPT